MNTQHIVRPFEIKSVSEDGTFEGYASVYGNIDSYGDIVAPGAFADTLRQHAANSTMPAMLWQHQSDQIPGVFTDIKDDSHGLYVKGQLLLKVQRGAEAYELLKAKALNGLSIGYMTKNYAYDKTTGITTLLAVDLWEISLVTFPANPAARVSGVKASENINTIREFEAFLRDVGGFSNAAAKSIASGGFKARTEHREDDDCSLTALLQQHNAQLKSLLG